MKRIIFITILVASLFIIKSLVESIYTLWQKQDLLTKAEKELEREERRNKELKEKVSYTSSEQFIEQEARNKLFMVKKGEQEILLPKNAGSSTDSGTLKPQGPNWKQWIELFFNPS